MPKARIFLFALLLLLCCTVCFFACGESTKTDACEDGHTVENGTIQVEPTCFSQGVVSGLCSVCGQSVVEDIPALGHTAGDWIVDLAAGCEREGQQHLSCVRCGTEMKTLTVDPIGHTEGEWRISVAPGCEWDGVRECACTDCGMTLKSEVIPATGHVEGEVKTIVAATCNSAGRVAVYCASCPLKMGEKLVYPLSHTWEWRTLQAASCLNNGQREQYCTGCGAVGDRQVIPCGGHTPGVWVTDGQGGCDWEGHRYQPCADCGTILDAEYFYDDNVHRASEWIVDEVPGCNTEGSQYCYCLGCGVEVARQILPATHTLGDWSTVTASTCLQAGREVQRCSFCPEVLNERLLPALGHVDGQWIQDADATCVTAGSKHKECSRCGTTTETGTIPATGHTSPSTWQVISQATCTTGGMKVKNCTTCGTKLQQEVLPAMGHASGVWVELASEDALPSAYMKFCCAACNAVLEGKSRVNKEEVVIASGSSATVNLSNYTRVVYPAKASSSYIAYARALAAKLQALTGRSVSAVADSTSAIAYEILLGQVSGRSAEETARADISGYGYTVQYLGNKIVITGTTDLIALMGADHFANTYLTGTAITVSMPQKATSDRYRPVTLVSADGSTDYSLVYDQHLDTDGSVPSGEAGRSETYYGAVNSTVSGGTNRDYVYDATLALKDRLLSLSSASSISTYSDATSARAKEILIGTPDRPTVVNALSFIEGHEYGIIVCDEKLVVTGYGKFAMQVVMPIFSDYLQDARSADGSIVFPYNMRLVGSAGDEWFVDAPKPQGLSLSATADGGDGALQYLYMNSNAKKSDFDAYCSQLAAAGYTLMTQNNASGSYFATYENKTLHTMVHVSFNAYMYASGSNYSYAIPSLRIITSYTDRVSTMLTVPTEEMLNPNQSYTKITDGAIVAVSLPGASVGTGYVILLEDGSFIVMDGGSAASGTGNSSSNWAEVKNMWKILSSLHEKAHGSAPSKQNPVHIRAWVISHSHGDHIGVLWDFTHRYGVGTTCSTSSCSCTTSEGRGAVKIDYLLTNVPAVSELYNTGEASVDMRTEQGKMRRYLTGNANADTFTYVKVQTGQKLYFANTEVEILFTHHDLTPQRIVTFNDTSSVMRFTSTPTQNGQKVAAGRSTFLFTGDVYMHGGRWMCAMYGPYLQSDMVTLAHHGGPGTEAAFYEKVQAKVLWVPNTTSQFNGWLTTSAATWIRNANQRAALLPSVRYIICANYVSGVYRNITVDLTTSGPALDNAYYTGASGSVVYGTVSTSNGKLSDTSVDIGKK